MAREIEQARREFGKHAVALRHLVARVQCRQLDRDAGSLSSVPAPDRFADDSYRVVIGGEIARRVDRRTGGLAEHVIGMPITVPLGFAGTLDRLLDRAAYDELTAEDAHCGDDRLAHQRL